MLQQIFCKFRTIVWCTVTYARRLKLVSLQTKFNAFILLTYGLLTVVLSSHFVQTFKVKNKSVLRLFNKSTIICFSHTPLLCLQKAKMTINYN